MENNIPQKLRKLVLFDDYLRLQIAYTLLSYCHKSVQLFAISATTHKVLKLKSHAKSLNQVIRKHIKIIAYQLVPAFG